jgi:hypothetical protein
MSLISRIFVFLHLVVHSFRQTEQMQLLPNEATISTLLEKLIVAQPLKFSFYRTRGFITVFTLACHLSVFWARWIHTLFTKYPIHFDPLIYIQFRIVQSVERRATGWTTVARFPAGARSSSLLHSVQTGQTSHLVFYPLDRGSGLKLTTYLL